MQKSQDSSDIDGTVDKHAWGIGALADKPVICEVGRASSRSALMETEQMAWISEVEKMPSNSCMYAAPRQDGTW